MERFGSCVLMALFAVVAGQNGPHVPDHGLVATAEGQLYAQPAIVEPRAAEPQGAATGYAPSGKYYGGGGGGGGGNGGYESNSYGGGGHGGGYGGGESGYVGNGGCYGRPAGVYGDASYDCKTFQVCQADGRLDTMYCPPYTRFNNYLGVCDWHFKVDAYCNPLYKEEYNNNYQSSYGGDSYDKGSQNYAPSYGGNSYQQSGNSYEKPSSYGNNQNSYGGNSYSSASTNYGSTGGTGYSSGYRTPVYSLQAYPAQQNSQAQKY